MATLLVQHGEYRCPECLQPIVFEYIGESPFNCTQLRSDGTAIGACGQPKCERKGLRLKVKLQTIEVEELHDA